MKRLFCLLLILAVAMNTSACDVCGCSASNQYLGLLPQLQWNFAGLQYEYSSFSSTHPSLFEGLPDEHAADYYNTVQAWGRYNIGKRLQVFAFVPYHFNRDHADTSYAASSGIGDVSFLIDRIMIKDPEIGSPWGHQLIAGGGIKLPTGRNTGITAPDRLGLPNLQPGTGSWDFIINSNYTVRYKKLGLNLDAAYTFTTANSHDFKYGNRLNAGLLAYYSPKLKGKLSLLPQAGLRYSYSLHDYDNYNKKWLNEQSGGYLLYADLGVQAYYRQLGLRLNYQLPLAQHYGAGYVKAGVKTEAGIFILF
jgi:hypothetical protein